MISYKMTTSRGLLAYCLLHGMFAMASDETSVTISQCDIAGLTLGDSKSLAFETLGRPKETGPECDDCIDIMDSWYVYEGLKLNFLQDELIMYSITSAEYRLSTGIGVGSSVKEVQSAYGIPKKVAFEGKNILRYPTIPDNPNSGLHSWPYKLDFWIREDHVTKVEFHPNN